MPCLSQPCSSSPEQRAVGIGGKRGLAGSGQSQEQGYAAIQALVGRSVQRQDPGLGQEVIHYREHQLFHAAHVGRADDHAGIAGEIHGHHHVRGAAVGQLAQQAVVLLLVQLVAGQGQERKRLVVIDAARDVPGHGAEHGRRKKRGQGAVADGAHRQGVAAVGAHDAVGDVEALFLFDQGQGIGQDHGESLRGQGQVVGRIPVDLLLDLRPFDRQGVLGAAPGRFYARPGGQRSVLADQHFLVFHRGLDQVAAFGVDVNVFFLGDQSLQAIQEIHFVLLLLKEKL